MEVTPKTLQAIHFICATADGMPLGFTRLNKILWFLEKESFLRAFSPVLGIGFVKGPHGPMFPEYKKACDILAEQGNISCSVRTHGPYAFTELRSLREPDTSLLSGEERARIQDLTWNICTDYSAKSISEATHNAIYDMLSMGEEYPLELALVEKARPATKEETDSLMEGGE